MTSHQHDREQDRERDSLTDIRAAFEHQYMADSRDPSMLEQFSTYTNGWQAATAAAVPPGHVVVPVSALQSILKRWQKSVNRYERIGSDHHLRMPGHWPFDVVMTMDEVRALVAAAEGK